MNLVPLHDCFIFPRGGEQKVGVGLPGRRGWPACVCTHMNVTGPLVQRYRISVRHFTKVFRRLKRMSRQTQVVAGTEHQLPALLCCKHTNTHPPTHSHTYTHKSTQQ